MSGIGHRGGVLTAAGHRVHRSTKPLGSEDQAAAARRDDEVPAVERYMELSARHMHRVATLPMEDRFVSGCSCGWAKLSSPDVSETEAKMEGAQHAIDEARKLQQKLENADEGASRG